MKQPRKEHGRGRASQPGWRLVIWLFHCFAWGIVWSSWVGSAQAATTVGVTVGSVGITLPSGLVACGDPAGGWSLESHGTRIRPPGDVASVGTNVTLQLAKSSSECSKPADGLTLTVIGRMLQIERKSVEVDIDQGRAELIGTRLDGARLWWRSAADWSTAR